jgi:hypothetical protein
LGHSSASQCAWRAPRAYSGMGRWSRPCLAFQLLARAPIGTTCQPTFPADAHCNHMCLSVNLLLRLTLTVATRTCQSQSSTSGITCPSPTPHAWCPCPCPVQAGAVGGVSLWGVAGCPPVRLRVHYVHASHQHATPTRSRHGTHRGSRNGARHEFTPFFLASDVGRPLLLECRPSVSPTTPHHTSQTCQTCQPSHRSTCACACARCATTCARKLWLAQAGCSSLHLPSPAPSFWCWWRSSDTTPLGYAPTRRTGGRE